MGKTILTIEFSTILVGVIKSLVNGLISRVNLKVYIDGWLIILLVEEMSMDM